MAKKAGKFPKVIHVRCVNPGTEDQYWDLGTDADDAENGEKVAIYELVETKTKRVTHELK